METKTLAQIVGDNAKKLRGNNTLEDIALEARRMGASWSSGSVSSIERGHAKPTIEVLVILSAALTNTSCKTTVYDLLSTQSGVKLTETTTITGNEISRFLNGGIVEISPADSSHPPTRTEIRLAEKAGIGPHELRRMAVGKWGISITQKRDEIASHDASPQKRGRITRELLTELLAN